MVVFLHGAKAVGCSTLREKLPVSGSLGGLRLEERSWVSSWNIMDWQVLLLDSFHFCFPFSFHFCNCGCIPIFLSSFPPVISPIVFTRVLLGLHLCIYTSLFQCVIFRSSASFVSVFSHCHFFQVKFPALWLCAIALLDWYPAYWTSIVLKIIYKLARFWPVLWVHVCVSQSDTIFLVLGSLLKINVFVTPSGWFV